MLKVPKDKTTKIIGITGTIGSGKSLVGSLLAAKKIPVIDADELVHQLLKSDPLIKAAIIEQFGWQVVNSDGSLDTDKLAAIIFDDVRARSTLEAIIHPAVIRECRRQVKELAQEPIVAILVPLLFEAGLTAEYHEIWTVVAGEGVIRERLKLRDNMSDLEIDKRLAAQWSQKAKAAKSHVVIDNSGTKENTKKQVEANLI